MGWGNTAYSWLTSGYSFIADTTKKVGTAITKIPSVAWSYVSTPTTRQITRSILHIVFEDLVPYLLLNQAFNSLQQYITDSSEENPHAWPTYFMLEAVKNVCQTSLSIYYLRQRQRSIARTAVLSLENNKAWTEQRVTKPFTICEDEECSDLRFLQGNIRDLSLFYISELGIYLLKYIPYVGKPLSIAGSIYNKGRYVVRVITPEMCQRHSQRYVDDNQSLTLSLGLLHKGSVFTTSQFISWATNLPADELENMLDFLFLLPVVATATRLDLPAPTKQSAEDSAKLWKDPLALYEQFMGWWVDVILYGLKKQVPKLFKGPKPTVDWNNVLEMSKEVINHPAAKLTGYILINDTFHSIARVKQDPVIKHFWTTLCLTMADIAEDIVSWGNSWTISALTYNQIISDMSAKFLHWYKRYPESLVKIAIAAIKNKGVQEWLLNFAKTLRAEKDVPDTLSANFFMREAQKLGHLLERCLQINHDDAHAAASIIIDGMLWGATPLRNKLLAKPIEAPKTPFKEIGTSRPTTLTKKGSKRPTNLHLGSKSSGTRPSSLSLFTPQKNHIDSPSDTPTLRLRPTAQTNE